MIDFRFRMFVHSSSLMRCAVFSFYLQSVFRLCLTNCKSVTEGTLAWYRLYWALDKIVEGMPLKWLNWWEYWKRMVEGAAWCRWLKWCAFINILKGLFYEQQLLICLFQFFSWDWLVLKDWDNNAMRYKWGSCEKSHLKKHGEA